jgi:hypothetical protein
MCPGELHEGAYGCIIHVKESIHPMVVLNKAFKIPSKITISLIDYMHGITVQIKFYSIIQFNSVAFSYPT